MSSTRAPSPNLDFSGFKGVSIHPYPATMPLPLAEFLVSAYSEPGDFIVDPFCGSGTTLRVAAALGRRSLGIDINPLACLIARVSVRPFDMERHMREYDAARSGILESVGKDTLYPDPTWSARINRWFEPAAQRALARLSRAISVNECSPHAKEFLLLVLSKTVRRSSLARTGELKLWRVEDTRSAVDPFAIFNEEAIALLRDLAVIHSQKPPEGTIEPVVCMGDAEQLLRDSAGVDLILTSPPYGDAWTTVAYGNFSMLSRIWLGAIDEAFVRTPPDKEDARSVGGLFRVRKAETPADIREASRELQSKYDEILRRDAGRARDMLLFSEDMFQIFAEARAALSPKARVVLVVGPRRVAGVAIDTGQMLSEFLEFQGLERVDRLRRRVTGKRLPSRSVQGASGIADTINEETIEILSYGGAR